MEYPEGNSSRQAVLVVMENKTHYFIIASKLGEEKEHKRKNWFRFSTSKKKTKKNNDSLRA